MTGASALAALRLLEENPSLYMGRLRFNTAYMKAKLSEAGIPVLPGDTSILPIVIGDEKQTLAYAKAAKTASSSLPSVRRRYLPVRAASASLSPPRTRKMNSTAQRK